MTQSEFQSQFIDNTDGPIKVELGCGPNKSEDAIGIDVLDIEGVDIVHDLEKPLSFIPDNSVDRVSSSHLLEHVSDLETLIREIYRILKPTGVHVAVVPHWSNPYYYSDYTHTRFFGLYTFDYMASKKTKLKRPVPDFYDTVVFDIQERHLNFKSHFMIRNLFKQVFKRIVNMSGYTQEFYEEVFSSWISCHEIKFEMSPVK